MFIIELFSKTWNILLDNKVAIPIYSTIELNNSI